MTTACRRQAPTYLECFAAQIGALGVAGQRRLQRASVLVVGAGGLGTAVGLTLANAGVGTLVLVDPQRVATDNFNRYAFARPLDVGRPKVDVLAAFFEGRPYLRVVPIFSRIESMQALRAARDVQFVVSASNTVSSRLTVADLAERFNIAHVAASIADGRDTLGGFVTAWLPERRELACPACYLTPGARVRRQESLLAPIVSTVGALAACMVVQLLARMPRTDVLASGNCVTIGLAPYTVESLRVLKRHDCPVCADVRASVKGRRHQR